MITALRPEAFALAGVPGAALLRTGMGPDRAARRLARAAVPAVPVLVAGLAGGLDPRLRPGSIVVATEVDDGSGAVPRPQAGPLVTELERRGLRPYAGALHTAARVVSGPARARLAVGGALAVDMESAAVLRALPGHRVAVVRVISDDAVTGLHPVHLAGGAARALALLQRLRPAFATWAGACGASPPDDTRTGPIR